jgi:hypothetical protein
MAQFDEQRAAESSTPGDRCAMGTFKAQRADGAGPGSAGPPGLNRRALAKPGLADSAGATIRRPYRA